MAAPDANKLSLPETLGPGEAPELADRFRALRGAPVEIEAHGVKRISALCVQVLISAAESWRTDGQPLRLIEPSPECEETLRLLGLSAEALTTGEAA